MSKTIKTLILVSVLCFGMVLISGCNLSKKSVDIEEKCCQECLNFIIEAQDSQKCLDNPEISDQCREFFEKNPDKEKSCLAGEIIIPPVKPPVSPPPAGDGFKPGDIFGKCDQPYVWWKDFEEIEKKFKGKKWSGALISNYPYSYTITLKVEELKINFESLKDVIAATKSAKQAGQWTPCDPYGLLVRTAPIGGGIEVVGSATVDYSTPMINPSTIGPSGRSGTWTCFVTNDPIPVKILGNMYFTDKGFLMSSTVISAGCQADNMLDLYLEETPPEGCTGLKLEGYCDVDEVTYRWRYNMKDEWIDALLIGNNFRLLDNGHIVFDEESNIVSSTTRGPEGGTEGGISGTLYLSP